MMSLFFLTTRSSCYPVRAWLSFSSTPVRRKHLFIVRGGASSSSFVDHHDGMAAPTQHQHQLSTSISTTPPLQLQSQQPVQVSSGGTTRRTMPEIAQGLAHDALMAGSKRHFGGLDYFDTSFDRRFRTIFILGGPGAGKGTQCGNMVDYEYPVSHFSVGELLRNVDSANPHKSAIDECLQNGQIVPVQVSLALLKSAMENAALNQTDVLYLVDGFPRNADNLQGWAQFMSSSTCVLAAVLVYTCPLDVLEQRILARNQGRSDDTVAAVQKRFRTFEQETMPVVRALQGAESYRWKVVEIDGNQDMPNVWAATRECLHQLMVHDVITTNQRLLTAAATKDAITYMALCDPKMFESSSDHSHSSTTTLIETEFTRTEGTADSDIVEKARVDVITGRTVAVSYDRTMNGGIRIREKRIWSHQGRFGWRNVHYQRTPCV
jgi:UMP-CMP kinase